MVVELLRVVVVRGERVKEKKRKRKERKGRKEEKRETEARLRVDTKTHTTE